MTTWNDPESQNRKYNVTNYKKEMKRKKINTSLVMFLLISLITIVIPSV